MQSQLAAIEVSPEMLTLVGPGKVGRISPPPRPVGFALTFGAVGTPATVRYFARPSVKVLNADMQTRLILLVSRAACERIAGGALALTDGGLFHLPAALRTIALAIRDCDLPDAASTPYRLAKSIELLCDLLRAHGDNTLVPVSAEGLLSRADTQRLLAARQVIDERWAEKLTLDMIARASGLNRGKLTRGFREMFDCTVADAISGHRLSEARQMLLATDLPISSIGYRCGYLNNASFTRAFARHFGEAPTHFRARSLAA
ncbi:AraC family transcriptional regulator [Novosphingobium sp. P6W]|uniref:helix-turn-helix domain-containing protein n=1 Tax=Novosphingobium sp. P6W TaxID=1609758 RepID=UPI0006989359|nr:AraC family transcriptional regulator [Novosphingobium sp. P6W]AXB79351.1 AraC family transcriptional regulator [Novosphingobium sp. P6W]